MTFSPNLGRWIEPDPIGFEGGDTDLYRFVGDNPTGYTDPSGLRLGAIVRRGLLGRESRMIINIPENQWDNRERYVTRNFPTFVFDPLSPLEERLERAVRGSAQGEREVRELLNAVEMTWVMPSIPVLGYFFSDTFGSHCVRWTNSLQGRLNRLPTSRFGRVLWMRQFTLRYPRRGGPEHSVILIRLRGRNNPVVGIDNGALNGGNNFFDPSAVINDESWPQEMRDDLRRALGQFRGG